MTVFTPFTPAVDYLRAALGARLATARAKEDGERGASVVEWVVITTIVVVIVAFVGGILYTKLEAKGQDIGTCIDNAGGANTGTCPNN